MKKRIIKTGTFRHYDRIYIDTSTLMNYEALRLFLNRYGNRGLKIIMPRAVRLELARHIDSGIPDKAEKSLECIRVMDEYPGLIVLDGGVLSEDLMYNTHADREILAMLTKDKGRYSQLLITSDKELAADALGLNHQLSCPGMEITVRRINRLGEIRPFNERQLLHAEDCAAKGLHAVTTQEKVTTAAGKTAEEVIPASTHPNTESGHDAKKAATVEPERVASSATPLGFESAGTPSGSGIPARIFALGTVVAGIVGYLLGAATVFMCRRDTGQTPSIRCY